MLVDQCAVVLSIHDGQRLQLSYRVKPQVGVGDTAPQLVNTATLSGKTDTNTHNSFEVSASNQEAVYTPPEGTAAVSIRKLEGNSSIQVMLQGAEFTAYPVDSNGQLGAPFQTWTTDANGKAMLQFQRNGDEGYDTVYCIKETKAPAGYVANDAEWYFCFTTGNGEYANDTVRAIVELLRSQNKNVILVPDKTVHQMNVENLPVVSDLRIRKANAEGEDLQGAVFSLQDAKGNQMPAPTTVTEDGVYYYVYEDLKSGDYTLTEITAPEGYQLSDPSSWNITLDSITKTVSVNCRQGCQGCGAMKYGVGVCTEPKTGA